MQQRLLWVMRNITRLRTQHCNRYAGNLGAGQETLFKRKRCIVRIGIVLNGIQIKLFTNPFLLSELETYCSYVCISQTCTAPNSLTSLMENKTSIRDGRGTADQVDSVVCHVVVVKHVPCCPAHGHLKCRCLSHAGLKINGSNNQACKYLIIETREICGWKEQEKMFPVVLIIRLAL